MTIKEACELMNKYAKCPECGSMHVGNDKGKLELDSKNGYFKRTCHCGWSIEINLKGEDDDDRK